MKTCSIVSHHHHHLGHVQHYLFTLDHQQSGWIDLVSSSLFLNQSFNFGLTIVCTLNSTDRLFLGLLNNFSQKTFNEGLLPNLTSNEYLILAGTFHGIHAITSKLSPVHPSGSGIHFVEAETFKLSCLQTLTGTYIYSSSIMVRFKRAHF